MRRYGRRCWRTKNECAGHAFLRLTRGGWTATDTTRAPGISQNLADGYECETRRLTLTAALWLRFVHFATPRGVSSPIERIDCPIRPLKYQRISNHQRCAIHSQQLTTLSLPPLARNCPSDLQVNPHTSALWPSSSITLCFATLTSW